MCGLRVGGGAVPFIPAPATNYTWLLFLPKSAAARRTVDRSVVVRMIVEEVCLSASDGRWTLFSVQASAHLRLLQA